MADGKSSLSRTASARGKLKIIIFLLYHSPPHCYYKFRVIYCPFSGLCTVTLKNRLALRSPTPLHDAGNTPCCLLSLPILRRSVRVLTQTCITTAFRGRISCCILGHWVISTSHPLPQYLQSRELFFVLLTKRKSAHCWEH